jgi:hypothetical protein
VARFSEDTSPEVLSAMLDGMNTIRFVFITPELQEPYAQFVRKTLRPPLDRLGLTKKTGEPEGVSLARAGLIRRLGEDGKDPRILDFADSLAKRFLADPGSVDPSLAGTVLNLSALRGDHALFAEYQRRFETAKVPANRSHFLNALGFFRDPKIVDEALHYALEGPLRPQEVFVITNGIGNAIEYDDVPFRWLTENYAAVMSHIPPMYGVYMPQFANGCSTARLETAEKFFAVPAHAVPGTDQELAKVADNVRDCTGLRQREGPSVAAYLSESVGSR